VYKSLVEDTPLRSFDSSVLREAMARRLHRRAEAEGKITVPAVPSLVDEYVKMCENVFAGMGVQYTAEQSAQLRTVLKGELTKAYRTSPRSVVVISFNAPWGTTLNYRVEADWLTIEEDYDRWVAVRPPPLFGSEPDARVWELAGEAADPRTHRVLDIGAGTGRNALALARRGHPVDAVEMTAKFADTIRSEAESQSLDIRVIQGDVFTATDGVESEYQLIVVSEVVPDFRTPSQLRGLFELSAQLLVPGGRLVLNTFLPRPGYTPDDAARELGQQFNSMIFTRDEVTNAAAQLPLELIADDPAYEYEKAHLPEGAWPPTGWFDGWANGLDIFDVEREESPIELRWLVYQKTG
jgi:2-polyprenyl-3-methyl-5-hydroxy-6-metoxy-1,4-benzoquinol methylase